MYHSPVLLHPSVEGMVTNPDGVYVDVTFGGGGHSSLILQMLSEKGRLIAFDQDPDAAANVPQDPRFQFVPSNFCNLKKFLQYYDGCPADGILADLGVSSHQFDTPERGFSHRFEGVLDMRMNSTRGLTAADIVNQYPEPALADLFYKYGELANGRQIATRIGECRETPIRTTADLVHVLAPLLPHGKENKTLSQVFQALRIEVNDEMAVLRSFLTQAAEVLKPGGRLAVISYHSLEDRLVKNFMKAGNFEGNIEKDFYGNPLTPFELVTRKVVVPEQDEIDGNPRARSAKLRIAARRNTTN